MGVDRYRKGFRVSLGCQATTKRKFAKILRVYKKAVHRFSVIVNSISVFFFFVFFVVKYFFGSPER